MIKQVRGIKNIPKLLLVSRDDILDEQQTIIQASREIV